MTATAGPDVEVVRHFEDLQAGAFRTLLEPLEGALVREAAGSLLLAWPPSPLPIAALWIRAETLPAFRERLRWGQEGCRRHGVPPVVRLAPALVPEGAAGVLRREGYRLMRHNVGVGLEGRPMLEAAPPVPGVTTRPVGDGDAPWAAELLARSMGHRGRWAAALRAFLQRALTSPHARGLVAEADGRRAGAIVRSKVGPASAFSYMAAEPWARGRGVGTALMRDVLALLHQEGVTLWAAVSMSPGSLAIYRLLGFTVEYPVELWVRPRGPAPWRWILQRAWPAVARLRDRR